MMCRPQNPELGKNSAMRFKAGVPLTDYKRIGGSTVAGSIG